MWGLSLCCSRAATGPGTTTWIERTWSVMKTRADMEAVFDNVYNGVYKTIKQQLDVRLYIFRDVWKNYLTGSYNGSLLIQWLLCTDRTYILSYGASRHSFSIVFPILNPIKHGLHVFYTTRSIEALWRHEDNGLNYVTNGAGEETFKMGVTRYMM